MVHDVSQWLAEIKTLKQQLAEAQQEREQAFSSATNWQRLYETEAQQRRAEAQLTRQTIEELRREILQLKGSAPDGTGDETVLATIRSEVGQVTSLEELREKLIAALADRDRLVQSLKTEQANHAQTRKSLTMALGDAIDMLSKGQQEG